MAGDFTQSGDDPNGCPRLARQMLLAVTDSITASDKRLNFAAAGGSHRLQKLIAGFVSRYEAVQHVAGVWRP
jgi:hypothetical protein